jgi:hypothetical protein
MDACLGFFEISREAGHAASHYAEHRRLMEIMGHKQP